MTLFSGSKVSNQIEAIQILINATKVGLETRIFGNGMASFGWTEPTGQEHHLWNWTTLYRKISTQTEVFPIFLDRDFRQFLHNVKHP